MAHLIRAGVNSNPKTFIKSFSVIFLILSKFISDSIDAEAVATAQPSISYFIFLFLI
ncbi:MAG: hypothetical protein AAB838_01515 [Patescibacteria group bacterium]